jgi:hypothetical protein
VNALPLEDDELLAGLRRAAGHYDPVPRQVLEAAKGAFALRTLDDELADLLFDSLLDDDLVGVRGGITRQLTFGVGDVTIDLDVEADELVGQVSPAATVGLAVETPDDAVMVEVDDRGRFFATRPTTGPFRLRLSLDDRQLTTEWVTL